MLGNSPRSKEKETKRNDKSKNIPKADQMDTVRPRLLERPRFGSHGKIS
jgi:hypothetical protein